MDLSLIGCSDPGAGAAIASAIESANIHAAVDAGLLLFSVGVFAIDFRRWWKVTKRVDSLSMSILVFWVEHGRWPYFTIVALMCLLHPAWTISAIHGDCGAAKIEASLFVTCVSTIIVAWQTCKVFLRKKST
jgi:hypothetical protein